MEKSIFIYCWRLMVGGGLFFLPLFYLPQAAIPFEVPKVWFVMIWVALIALSEIFLIAETQSVGRMKKLHLLVMVWFFILAWTSLWGVDPVKSWLGNYYRWDGLTTIITLVGLFFVLSLFPRSFWTKWAMMGMALGNVTSSVWVMAQMILNKGAGFEGFGAGFGQPAFLAGYLLVTTPFVWWLTERIKQNNIKRICFWVTTIFITMGLLATKTLISLVGLPILLMGFFVIKKKVDYRVVIILSVVILTGAMTKYYAELKKEEVGGGMAYEGRERLLMKPFLAFRKRPIWGWGWANFDRAFEAVDWPIKMNNDVYADKAHSNLEEMAVTTGLLGLVSYLFLVGVVIRGLMSKKDLETKFCLLALVIYLIHSQTNVTSVAEEVVFWLVTARATYWQAWVP